MSYSIRTYGFDKESLLTSPETVRQRLAAILGDKIMRFNPFTVDDDTLLACAERATYQPWPTFAQMAIFHFHDIRMVEWKRPYKALFYHIGNDETERHISINSFTQRITYTATLRSIHITINGRPVTNEKMVERMQGKDYFLSHVLPARISLVRDLPAYRFHRLKGDTKEQASLIRVTMVEAKITILKEILEYPFTPEYLNCSRDFINYSEHINAAINSYILLLTSR